MPSTAFHLWIANELSVEHRELKHADFFLGSIAPDAILSRLNYSEKEKQIAHICADRPHWKENTIQSLNKEEYNTLFGLGYHLHILTDIYFREKCKSLEDFYHIPVNLRNALIPISTALGLEKLIGDWDEYLEWVSFAANYTVIELPFGITIQDIDKEINYARSIPDIVKQDLRKNNDTLQLPDYSAICIDSLQYLNQVLDEEAELCIIQHTIHRPLDF